MSIRKSFILAIFTVLFGLFQGGCGSSETVVIKTADEYFKAAKAAFEDRDWLDAIKFFEVIKLQYPASQYADDAQYYLAEINYKRGEYYMAAYNYATLRRIYPQSEFQKEALFKTALSFYEISPAFDRDQDYTRKAIQTFSEFQVVYPKDSLADRAGAYIVELRNKLAEKYYTIAELYRNLQSIESSLVYYDAVIEEYPDSKFFEPAYYGKIEVLNIMKKYEQLRSIIILYGQLFPKSSRLSQVKDIEKNLPF
jgi:outer membrane protein assembly factor BamD